MSNPNEDYTKIWDLIRQAHSALLVTVGQDGRLDSRPMGCLQAEFDDTLWLLTFRDSSKVRGISHDDRILASYAKPADYTCVSLSARARLVEDQQKLRELWFEGLRVWLPNGPSDPELAILAVRVEEATYWTNAASTATYAWAYVRAALTHKSSSPGTKQCRVRRACWEGALTPRNASDLLFALAGCLASRCATAHASAHVAEPLHRAQFLGVCLFAAALKPVDPQIDFLRQADTDIAGDFRLGGRRTGGIG